MSGIQEIVEYKEKSCEFKDTKEINFFNLSVRFSKVVQSPPKAKITFEGGSKTMIYKN
ncbi:MAG: hypothetical protein J7K20_00665 [Thermodesulfobacterium sp.]|nr:hypothetical protein [Thermodesulfobacterium sp.]